MKIKYPIWWMVTMMDLPAFSVSFVVRNDWPQWVGRSGRRRTGPSIQNPLYQCWCAASTNMGWWSNRCWSSPVSETINTSEILNYTTNFTILKPKDARDTGQIYISIGVPFTVHIFSSQQIWFYSNSTIWDIKMVLRDIRISIICI